MLNSLYGATANEGFRFFNTDIAESITLTGQYILKSIEVRINSVLNNKFGTKGIQYLIYSDTDSVFFNLQPVVDKFLVGKSEQQIVRAIEKLAVDVIQAEVNVICNGLAKQLNFFDNRISFKLEKVADRALFVAMKKYAMRVHSSEGVSYAKPKIKTTGLELVRSSTPAFIRGKLKQSLELIFSSNVQAVQQFIQETKTEFMKLPLADVAFPRGANNLKKYEGDGIIYTSGTPIQVRGALLYNHYVKKMKLTSKYPLIKEGSKIKFFYLKVPNTIRENVFAVPVEGDLPLEFDLHKYIDYEMQFEKSFLAAMQIMMTPIGWDTEVRSSLDEFFN